AIQSIPFSKMALAGRPEPNIAIAATVRRTPTITHSMISAPRSSRRYRRMTCSMSWPSSVLLPKREGTDARGGRCAPPLAPIRVADGDLGERRFADGLALLEDDARAGRTSNTLPFSTALPRHTVAPGR